MKLALLTILLATTAVADDVIVRRVEIRQEWPSQRIKSRVAYWHSDTTAGSAALPEVVNDTALLRAVEADARRAGVNNPNARFAP